MDGHSHRSGPISGSASRVGRGNGTAPTVTNAALVAATVAVLGGCWASSPPNQSISIDGVPFTDAGCAAAVDSLSIRPPAVGPSTVGSSTSFEVEALGYTTDGQGIPSVCTLPLTWSPSPSSQDGNRATFAVANPPVTTITVQLASDPGVSAKASVSWTSSAGDQIMGPGGPAVSIALVDGKAAGPSSCLNDDPVGFVGEASLANLVAACAATDGWKGAAVFRRGMAARFASAPWTSSAETITPSGSTELDTVYVAVWIAIDAAAASDAGFSSVQSARDDARDAVRYDVAWANGLYRAERVGMVIDTVVSVVNDATVLKQLLDPGNQSAECTDPGASTVSAGLVFGYPCTSAYDADAVNVYYVRRAWFSNRHFPRTDSRTDVITMRWPTTEPSLLAHEVGHVLALHDADGVPLDNLMALSVGMQHPRLTAGQLFRMSFHDSSWAAVTHWAPLGHSFPCWVSADRCPSEAEGAGW